MLNAYIGKSVQESKVWLDLDGKEIHIPVQRLSIHCDATNNTIHVAYARHA